MGVGRGWVKSNGQGEESRAPAAWPAARSGSCFKHWRWANQMARDVLLAS